MINFTMTNRACKKTSLPLRDRQSFSVEREKNTKFTTIIHYNSTHIYSNFSMGFRFLLILH